MWYYEVTVNVRKRATFVHEDKVFEKILIHGKKEELFSSVFQYKEEDLSDLVNRKSVSQFYGIRKAHYIPLDIDRGNSSDQKVLDNAREILSFLFRELNLHEDNLWIWFSGTGYHIMIHAGCFDLEPDIEYPYKIKETLKNLLETFNLDKSVYSRSALIRCPFTLNIKSGRYKIPLSADELFSLTYEEIHILASDYTNVKERMKWYIHESKNKFGDGELKEHVVAVIPTIRQINDVIEPFKMASCIHRLWELGPQQGTRNNTILRLASHFRKSGIPSDAAKAAILYWNNNSLDEGYVMEKVEYAYNKGYQYSCNDTLLKKNCNTQCIHYDKKNIVLDVYTADDMHKELISYINTDYSKRVIHLDKMLGLDENKDVKIYPGELVTFMGATGTNKSTLIQNIILGVNFVNGQYFDVLPTFYFAPELAPRLTHRRALQIVSNTDKIDVLNKANELYEQYKDRLDHIRVVAQPPTLAKIEDAIIEYGTDIVVVDYIELIDIEQKTNEESKIKYIMQRLSNIAVQKDIIIIMVSQISRSYSREGVLDLYAGHGSGGIEKSSRKVIGIKSVPDTNIRNIEMFKNQDGDLFNVNIEVLPSYKMRRIFPGETHGFEVVN